MEKWEEHFLEYYTCAEEGSKTLCRDCAMTEICDLEIEKRNHEITFWHGWNSKEIEERDFKVDEILTILNKYKEYMRVEKGILI
ncbi:MAG: hypothetical protein GY834_08320 [Bacteroidetes bacterium]|nr:hypothetical protein [Bacteroidota bacterium]